MKKENKKISIEEVEKLALLSRINLSEDEKKDISDSSASILGMIDTILEVEIDEKDIKRDYRKINIMREDEAQERTSKNRDDVLAQMPKTRNDYLETKKILSK